MATVPPLDILGSFADPLNQDAGASKLVNCRVVARAATEGKPGKARLVGSPGLTVSSQPDTTACIVLGRALGTLWSGHANGNIYYGVETGTPALAGQVAVGSPPIIRMAEDRTALCIASNSNVRNVALNGTGYTAVITGGVTDCGFDASIDFDPSTVCELDNRTIWSGASNFYANQSSKMYASAPLSPANVDANAFATKEARADAVLDLVTLSRNFWPFGETSVEMYYDAGTADFPFTPFTNSMLECGLAYRRTLASLHGAVMWLGTDRRIWLGTGQTGQPVSPQWLDLLLQQVDISQLTAYMYAQGGDGFYVLTYEGQWSLEMSVRDQLWTYRQSNGRNDYVGRCAYEYAKGVTYVGTVTGHVCRLDMTTANDPAGTMPRTIISEWIGTQTDRHGIDSVDITSYLGPSAGSFSFDWSEDCGVTWRGARQITFGQPGKKRAIARQLGSSRRRQLRIQYGGTVAPFAIDELFATITAGT